jgi:hypothetical protein
MRPKDLCQSNVPPGISRPNFGIGTEAKIGMLDSRTFRTAGKKDELYISIFPTSSTMKRSVSSLT